MEPLPKDNLSQWIVTFLVIISYLSYFTVVMLCMHEVSKMGVFLFIFLPVIVPIYGRAIRFTQDDMLESEDNQ